MRFSFGRLMAVGVGGGVVTVCYLNSSIVFQLFSSDSTTPNQRAMTVPHNMTLKSVQVFFRHGARTPLRHIKGLEEVTYDKNSLIKPLPYTEVPYVVEYLHGGTAPPSRLEAIYAKTSFKGGVIAGMLTTVGKDQAYQLGQRLAKRYRQDLHFISDDYLSHEILARSTNIQRCIDSLQCVFAGLFGVESFKNKQPLVIRVDTAENEILYPNGFSCAALRLMTKYSQEQYMNSSDFVKLIKQVQAQLGDTSPANEYDVMQLRDHIVARKAHGLAVPDFLEKMSASIDRAAVDVLIHHVCGVASDYCTAGQKCAKVEAASIDGCREMDLHQAGITLAMGQVWHMIMQTMQNTASQSNSSQSLPKMYLYSCHDSSLAPMLIVMGCYDNKWPPYAADITFELYEDADRRHWVSVSYCDKDQILAGCSKPLIPLEKFQSIVGKFTVEPDKYKMLCSDTVSSFPNAEVPPANFD